MNRIIGNIIAGLTLPAVFAIAMFATATPAEAAGKVCFVKSGVVTHCVDHPNPGIAYVYL